MKIFNASDVVQFAIRIEEDGEAFYRKVASAVSDKELQTFFNFLADEETHHKSVFSEMLSRIENVQAAETYDGEYAAYLSDYIDNKVIFTRQVQQELGSDKKDMISAIDFAMQRETDSILYYHEAKQFVAEKYYDAIDNIIKEERKHFRKLADLKKQYS